MNKFNKQLAEIEKLFKLSTLNLWVISYGITHRVMLIALFEDNFMERVEVTLGGCRYFSGSLDGDPYGKLYIAKGYQQDDFELFTIHDDENRLKIEFEQMTTPLPWKDRFKRENQSDS